MDKNFEGKVVAITGAAGGFGQDFVKAFATRGARVYCSDIRAEGGKEAEALGATAKVVSVTDRTQVKDWIAEVEASAGGAIDILINNAGGTLATPPRLLEDVSYDEWDRIFAVNVDGTFAVCRAAVPAMKRAGRGRIINISSGAGIAASRTKIHPYTSTKHAIVGLTRQMAAELGEFGITVNSVAPGFIPASPYTKRIWDEMPAEAKHDHLQNTFMRRVGTPGDVTNAVLFLASEETSWISGQILSVNGGMR
jgi:3-oxoacyl-[acyl-carrier protein] reductase